MDVLAQNYLGSDILVKLDKRGAPLADIENAAHYLKMYTDYLKQEEGDIVQQDKITYQIMLCLLHLSTNQLLKL